MAKVTSDVNKYLFAVIAIIIVLAGVSAIITSGLTTTATTTSTYFSNHTATPINTTVNGTSKVYTTTAGSMAFEGVVNANDTYVVYLYINGVLIGNNSGVAGSYHIDFPTITALNGENNVTYMATALSGALNVTDTNFIYTVPVSNTMSPLYALILGLIPLGVLIGAIALIFKKRN